MIDDEQIGSFNGVRGTPQDKLANGCAYILGYIAFMAFAVFLAHAGEHWWRG